MMVRESFLSFDPNVLPPLWRLLNEVKEQILFGLIQCDIPKIAEEELEFVTGIKDIQKGVEYLEENLNI